MDEHREGYYDMIHNRIFVRGFKYSDGIEHAKFLEYPGVLSNIYSISEDGQIYSIMNDCYIAWAYRDNLPYVNLVYSTPKGTVLEPIYIKDLMAYNYIANARDYIERGYRAAYIDGNPSNCTFSNIIYLASDMEC